MKRMAFISRHKPTAEQEALARQKGYELVHLGDRDGFSADFSDLESYDAVSVVHAAAALRVLPYCQIVGIWENGRRPGPDGKPEFYPVALHVYEVASMEVSGCVNSFPPQVREL